MTSFNEESLKKKLADLNMSQQSIQTLSLWLIHHKKHSSTIVNIWFKDLLKTSDSKKLALMYLANDVIQNSKKKGPEYRKQFISVLPKVFKHLGAIELNEKASKGIKRLLQVWGDRGVFDADTVKIFGERIGYTYTNGADGTKKRSSDEEERRREKKLKRQKEKNKFVSAVDAEDDFPAAFEPDPDIHMPSINLDDSPLQEIPSTGPPSISASVGPARTDLRPPPDPEELIVALQSLENAATSDAEVRQKIASLPQAVSDLSGFAKLKSETERKELEAKVDEALEMLESYNKRLSEEMECRKSLAKLLHDFISHQKDLLVRAEETLEEHRNKFNDIQKIRGELKAHLQNLPEIPKLPNLGGGLKPLPSAGNLFT